MKYLSTEEQEYYKEEVDKIIEICAERLKLREKEDYLASYSLGRIKDFANAFTHFFLTFINQNKTLIWEHRKIQNKEDCEAYKTYSEGSDETCKKTIKSLDKISDKCPELFPTFFFFTSLLFQTHLVQAAKFSAIRSIEKCPFTRYERKNIEQRYNLLIEEQGRFFEEASKIKLSDYKQYHREISKLEKAIVKPLLPLKEKKMSEAPSAVSSHKGLPKIPSKVVMSSFLKEHIGFFEVTQRKIVEPSTHTSSSQLMGSK